MNESIAYEIARYADDDDAEPLERIQLVSTDGGLKLRDASGAETPCEGADVVAAISSTSTLREIRDEQDIRITCRPEIVGQLPFVLEPVTDGDDTETLAAKVNDAPWCAFRTADEGFVMLPGRAFDDAPDMNPCWAEFQVGEGEYNPLVGWTSIGLVFPGIAVEYARYNHGGWGTVSAVAIKPFDDLAAVFRDWLLGIEVLGQLWGGDSSPSSPGVALFEAAAKSEDRKGSWSTDEFDHDESDEDEDEEAIDCEVDNSGWMHLKLHLPDLLIQEVRECLRRPLKQPK